jgi:hypothetical protein
MLKIDALFNFMGALLFFILVLIAQVNPPTTPTITPPGNLIVFASWRSGNDDVDLWVQYGKEPSVGYSNKSGATFSLLRDDLGKTNDSTPLNYESAFSRGLPDGEYVVNVKCFRCGGPVAVAVEIRLAQGALIWTGTVNLAATKQERTALRFRMVAGAVVQGSANKVFKPLAGGEA